MDDGWEDKKLQNIPRHISPLHSELTDLSCPLRYWWRFRSSPIFRLVNWKAFTELYKEKPTW